MAPSFHGGEGLFSGSDAFITIETPLEFSQSLRQPVPLLGDGGEFAFPLAAIKFHLFSYLIPRLTATT
jgi:hypothetical protein